MNHILAASFIIAGLFVAGCTKAPTHAEFMARETRCLEAYCSSNAVMAEAALIECARYAQQCQQAGVQGILYDEVFARTYGRLYLVERHLGNDSEAERYLEKYAYFHGLAGSLARQTDRPHGEMERLIEQKFDTNLQVAWKNQVSPDATGKQP